MDEALFRICSSVSRQVRKNRKNAVQFSEDSVQQVAGYVKAILTQKWIPVLEAVSKNSKRQMIGEEDVRAIFAHNLGLITKIEAGKSISSAKAKKFRKFGSEQKIITNVVSKKKMFSSPIKTLTQIFSELEKQKEQEIENEENVAKEQTENEENSKIHDGNEKQKNTGNVDVDYDSFDDDVDFNEPNRILAPETVHDFPVNVEEDFPLAQQVLPAQKPIEILSNGNEKKSLNSVEVDSWNSDFDDLVENDKNQKNPNGKKNVEQEIAKEKEYDSFDDNDDFDEPEIISNKILVPETIFIQKNDRNRQKMPIARSRVGQRNVNLNKNSNLNEEETVEETCEPEIPNAQKKVIEIQDSPINVEEDFPLTQQILPAQKPLEISSIVNERKSLDSIEVDSWDSDFDDLVTDFNEKYKTQKNSNSKKNVEQKRTTKEQEYDSFDDLPENDVSKEFENKKKKEVVPETSRKRNSPSKICPTVSKVRKTRFIPNALKTVQKKPCQDSENAKQNQPLPKKSKPDVVEILPSLPFVTESQLLKNSNHPPTTNVAKRPPPPTFTLSEDD